MLLNTNLVRRICTVPYESSCCSRSLACEVK